MPTPETTNDPPTCRVIASGDAYRGQQDMVYRMGITGQTVGARGICMTLATLPPGARTKAHLHHDIETAVYVIEGEAYTYSGDALQHRALARGGEYVYIPADLPHIVVNHGVDVCRAIVAHTAADDQAGIVLLPELDTVVPREFGG